MSDTDVIKEFLVALGFKVDESSFKKFGAGVEGATKEVALLGAGVTAAAVATEAFAVRMAESLDKLYFATARTGASADQIGDFQLAVQKLGGSADGAMDSLQAIARFRRTTPGAGADTLLKAWGVAPEDIGNSVKELEDLARHFRQIPEALAYREAGTLGIDEGTLLAMLNPNFEVGHDVADAYKTLGINQAEALKGAHDFQNQIRTMMADFGVFGTWVESQLVGPLGDFNSVVLSTLKSVERLVSLTEKEGLAKALEDHGVPASTATYLSHLFDTSPEGQKAKIDSAHGVMGDLDAWMTAHIDDKIGFGAPTDSSRNALSFFKSKGWSQAQAAGIVQNLMDESGLDPSKIGDNGQAAGIAQWHSDRQENFLKRYGHDLAHATLGEELDFVNYELTQGSEKAAGDRLRQDGVASTAGYDVSKYYERPQGGDLTAAWRGVQADHLSRDMNVNAPVTINVTGSDPAATASAVAAAQRGVTEHLVGEMSRNFGGVQ